LNVCFVGRQYETNVLSGGIDLKPTSLHGPVGMSRVYARVSDGPLDPREWLESLKAGRTFATNGPLLGLEIGGAHIGDELKFDHSQERVNYSVFGCGCRLFPRLDRPRHGRNRCISGLE
jgi:hypothetical protein